MRKGEKEEKKEGKKVVCRKKSDGKFDKQKKGEKGVKCAKEAKKENVKK